MKQPAASRLLAALTVERTALLEFVALLEREQGMLVENRADQLIALSEQKSSSVLGLNKLAETRRALLQQDIPQLSVDAIHRWLETHDPANLAVWREVVTLAERAQQLNNTNGELIQMKLRHNQQSLAILGNAVNKTSLYGSDGQHSFSPGSGRSLGSS